MFIADLVESKPKQIVVVYPGRFQPFHKGHAAVYNFLVKKFGQENVYIATSNKVEPPKSPFNFAEKLQMIRLAGINPDQVVQTKDPYRALEIAQKYDPNNTVLVFAVSEKDMAEDPRFSKFTKKDGSLSYLQPAPKNLSQAKPFSQHGYILTVPTFNFTVLGKPMRSASEFRKQFATADDETKKALIKDLFGNYSPEVFALMSTKITEKIEEWGLEKPELAPVNFNLTNMQPKIRKITRKTNDGTTIISYEILDSHGNVVYTTNDKRQAVIYFSRNKFDLMEDPERAWKNRMRKAGAVFFQNQNDRIDIPGHKGQYTYAYRVDKDQEDWPHILIGKFDHAQNRELRETEIEETLKRVNGKWALVSKSNPNKVLQYYKGGDQRPSKEWVKKVERRVHSFEATKSHNKNLPETNMKKQIGESQPLDGLPRIRRVTKELADGTKLVTYEVLDSEGVTVKSGLSKELAKSYLSTHRYELMREDKKPMPQELAPLKPRNFVAKNAVNTGAGAHKDKKRAMKQGIVKHRNRMFDDASPLTTPNNSKKRVCGLEEATKDMLAKEALAGALGFGGSNADAGMTSSIISSKNNKERTEQDKVFAEKITDPNEKSEYLERLKHIIYWRNMSMASPAMMTGYQVREKKFQAYKAKLEKKYKSKKENNIRSLDWKRQIHESYGENIRFWRDRAGNKTIAKNLDTNEIVGEYQHSIKTEDAASVGIITKQNTTKDVVPETIKKNLQAFKLIPKKGNSAPGKS